MENAPKQRPAWFYVLVGCGGAAGVALIVCLVSMLTCGKCVSDVGKGVTDPAVRRENAIKQLGAIPEGYNVVTSFDVMLGQTTIMVDSEPLPDGGFDPGLSAGHHVFVYRHVMSNDNNKNVRDFLMGKEVDPALLMNTGIYADPDMQLKRGSLTVDSRKLYYVAQRGPLDGEPGLLTTVLFDCPGNALSIGTWGQLDPAPSKSKDELELAGTVADEEQLARFLKPMNPCR